MAWTVPALTNITSPFFTGTLCSTSVNVPSSTCFRHSSLVSSSLKPTYRPASDVASITYHISFLPYSPSTLMAYSSSGCTCTERDFVASISLIKSGKRSNGLHFHPQASFPIFSRYWGNIIPFALPSTTLDGPALCAETSQLSAMICSLLSLFFFPYFS